MTLIKHLSFVIGFEFYVLSDRSLIAKKTPADPSSFVKKFQNVSLYIIVSHIIKGVQSVGSNKDSLKRCIFVRLTRKKKKEFLALERTQHYGIQLEVSQQILQNLPLMKIQMNIFQFV